LGVLYAISTPYIVGVFPQIFPSWYLISAFGLFSMRAYIYFKRDKKFFLLDFCYFANACIMIFLLFFPKNETYFIMCWGFANGPLALSVVAWRNSMVFHSLDKVTSVFLHMSPAILMYGLRWKWHGTIAVPVTLTFWDSMVYTLVPYIVWQFAYWVIVFVIYENKVPTAGKFLLFTKGGLPAHLSNIPFGKENAIYGLIVVQLAYTIITTLPVVLYFHYEWIHFLFLVYVEMQAISNGSDFYFKIFLDRYKSETKEMAAKRAQDLQKGVVQKKTVPRMILIGVAMSLMSFFGLLYPHFSNNAVDYSGQPDEFSNLL